MSLDTAVLTYKNTENIYAKGIETPHGRIRIVFDVIETNIDKMLKKHPKTDFVAYGKVLISARWSQTLGARLVLR